MAKRMPNDIGELKEPRTPTRAAKPEVTEQEIKARASARLRKVPVFRLAPHPLQPTERHADENVAGLAESIRSLGLQEPPLVRAVPGGQHVILAGHRRVRAWQLLASRGEVADRIPAFVLSGLADGEDVAIIAAEYAHQEDFSPLHAARIVGAAVEYRKEVLGRAPTVREMVALVPWKKSQISKYHKISEALDDPRLAPLVHRVDKPSISLLYSILSQTEFSRVETALEAYGNEGAAAARAKMNGNDVTAEAETNGTRGGRPLKTVTKEPQGGGYDLLVRFRPSMSEEDMKEALKALGELRQELEARVSRSGAE